MCPVVLHMSYVCYVWDIYEMMYVKWYVDDNDTCDDILTIWYVLWYVLWYDMIWYVEGYVMCIIWHNMIYDMIRYMTWMIHSKYILTWSTTPIYVLKAMI